MIEPYCSFSASINSRAASETPTRPGARGTILGMVGTVCRAREETKCFNPAGAFALVVREMAQGREHRHQSEDQQQRAGRKLQSLRHRGPPHSGTEQGAREHG